MYQPYKQTPKPETIPPPNRVIDYSNLVEAVQLSVARLLDTQGSHEARSFSEVLAHKSSQEQESIINEVGGLFDDALINLVTVSLIAQRNKRIVILAEEADGINGALPWQPKLEQHVQMLRENGQLGEAHIQVERYASSDIESLTKQAHALEPTPTN